jgi:hypothetical protein
MQVARGSVKRHAHKSKRIQYFSEEKASRVSNVFSSDGKQAVRMVREEVIVQINQNAVAGIPDSARGTPFLPEAPPDRLAKFLCKPASLDGALWLLFLNAFE